MKNEKGFTLVEVVASIVLITIILLSFAQLFIQSNKTAAYNNEMLVTINLADAMLAKARATKGNIDGFVIDPTKTDEQTTHFSMNNKDYLVIFQASQSNSTPTNAKYSEEELKLVKVVVTVCPKDGDDSCEGKTKGTSEGYIYYD